MADDSTGVGRFPGIRREAEDRTTVLGAGEGVGSHPAGSVLVMMPGAAATVFDLHSSTRRFMVHEHHR